MKDFEKLLQDWDLLIRSGQGSMVRAQLDQIAFVDIPRRFLSKVSRVACRAGYPDYSIRALNPIVRSEKLNINPTEEEQLEYALALSRIFAIDEALQLFETIDKVKFPEANFLQALTYFSRWQYSKSIPLLIQYIDSDFPNTYQKVIARLNLAAAYAYEKEFEASLEQCEKVLEFAKNEDNKLLQGNTHELKTNVFLHLKDYQQADIELKLSNQSFEGSTNSYQIFNKKWKAVLALHRGDNQIGVELLDEVRLFAKNSSRFETIRDCDYQQLCFSKDQNLFNKLYFGTPFDNYKSKLLNEFSELKPDREFIRWLHLESKTKEKVIDLDDGRLGNKPFLKPGHLALRLFRCLSEDFYAPKNVPSIFAKLYPDEYYNPESSPHRIYSLISRSREILENAGLKINIQSKNEFYWLQSKRKEGLLIRDSLHQVDTLKFPIHLFPEDGFEPIDVALKMKVSKRTAIRWVNEGLESNRIVRIKRGRKSLYKKVS